MSINRRDLLRFSALAGSALALPAFADTKPAKPLRILILGGTGFIGPHQVRYALARGHKVTLFNRGHQKENWPGPVEELIGDRNNDLKALEGRSWDVCIDNPTTLPVWIRDAARVLKGHVGQYIFISTVGVYAAPDKSNDETGPLAAYKGADPMAETQESFKGHPGLYGPLKAVSEREVQAQYGKAATIIRPGLIVGPGDETDRFTYWPVRLARGGEILAPGDGSDPVQVMDVGDLDEWIIRMAEQHVTGVFNATGPAAPITMRETLVEIAKGVHVDPKIVWASTAVLKANDLLPWRDIAMWVPGRDDPTSGMMRMKIDRAVAAGLTYRPLAVTAADTLAWFRTQPAERQAKLRVGFSPEKEAEVLAKLRG